MKRRELFLLLLLLSLAGAIGWLLPMMVVEVGDRALEGNAESVSIRKIDLSYQSDLSVPDKMRLMQERFPTAQVVALERGIFLSEQEAYAVLEQFLEDLTGYAVSLRAQKCIVSPYLFSFDEDGAVLAWIVQLYLNGEWECQAVVDDETGLLLRCELSGHPDGWDSLFPSLVNASDVKTYLCSALGDAMCAHCRRQLSAEYAVTVEASAYQDHPYGRLRFSENGQNRMEVSFLLVLEDGYLALNPGAG